MEGVAMRANDPSFKGMKRSPEREFPSLQEILVVGRVAFGGLVLQMANIPSGKDDPRRAAVRWLDAYHRIDDTFDGIRARPWIRSPAI